MNAEMPFDISTYRPARRSGCITGRDRHAMNAENSFGCCGIGSEFFRRFRIGAEPLEDFIGHGSLTIRLDIRNG